MMIPNRAARIAVFELEGRADDEDMTAPLVLSTEFPVDRGEYIEILSHEAGDVDLSRANPSLPLITSHDTKQLPIGVIENLRVFGKKLRGVARFSDRARALYEDVKKGILRGVSIGYELLEPRSVGNRTFVFKFRVLEASIVAIPADPGAGFFRHRGSEMVAATALRRYADRELEQGLERLHALAQARLDKPHGAIGMDEKEIQSWSVLRAIRELLQMKQAGRAWALSGVEGDANRECEKKYGPLSSALSFYIPPEVQHRVLTAGVAEAGGNIVGTSTTGSYIEALRNRSVAARLGAVLMPGQIGDLAIPRQSTAATVTWLTSEMAAISAADQALEQVTASPKAVGVYTEVTQQLVLQANPAAEGLVMADLAAASALAQDDAVLNGDGNGGKPVGIRSTSGVGTFSGATLDLSKLAEAQEDVLTENAMLNPDALGYATTPAVAKLLKGRPRFTGMDTPLWQGALHDGMIEGVRAISSKQLADATAIYGDWSQALIPEWGSPVVEVNPVANFRASIIGLKIVRRFDVIIRHAKSFTITSSIS